MDQLPRLGKRELICLLLFTCDYVVSVGRGFLFPWVPGMGCATLLCHSLSLQYKYIEIQYGDAYFIQLSESFLVPYIEFEHIYSVGFNFEAQYFY